MKSPLKMLEQHRTRGVLVDANLVYLFFVGTVRRALIGKAPHTDGYSVEDYDRLSAMLGWFRHRYVTPNVLTEVSNLAGKLEGNHRRAVWIMIRTGFDRFDERHIPSQEAASSSELERFGLTDAVLTALVRQQFLLLTADAPLAGYCLAKGGDAINFNHLRNWGNGAFPVFPPETQLRTLSDR